MTAAVAVDLGTSRTLVADVNGRILVDEPTLAAVDLASKRMIAFGEKAAALRGRAAGSVAVLRPVRHGQPEDLGLTDQIAADLLRRARRAAGSRPEVLCCVPGAATSVQRRALERSFKKAGARRIEFLEHAVACGIAGNLRLEEPVASMVMDVGSATTDIVVMALGGVVTGESIAVGGDDFDQAIRMLCARSFDLVIDPSTAEAVKLAIGTAWPGEEAKVEVHGRDASTGTPRSVVLSSSEVAGILTDPIVVMVAAAVRCITSSPPDLANDLLSRGLHLAGGGGLLAGFAKRLATATGIPVHQAEDPTRASVLGAARCLRALGQNKPPVERRQPATAPEG